MNKTFNLLFYVKKSKTQVNGTAPIYLKITIDGKPFEIASKRYSLPEKWCPVAKKVNGQSEEVRALNAYLKTLEKTVYEAYRQLVDSGKQVTAEMLKNKLQGQNERELTLVTIFEDHNRKMEALLGKEFAMGTLINFRISLRHVKEFLQWKYKGSDIRLQDLNHAFVTEYEFYLRSACSINNNSALKNIRNLGKIVRIAMANGWITQDPFAHYKTKMVEVKKEILNEEELAAIRDKVFSIERLSQVRDIFLFSCYTGLAYADAKKLDASQVSIGIDGEKWIFTNRQKTDTTSNIPLLPMAEAILEKYKKHPQCIAQNRLLPVLSNQKMNSYLKEIADLCGVSKPLTFHIARYTFATTVTLVNDVPIESVSSMMGHKSIKTTQHYAKIVNKKVSNDMKALREKLMPRLTIVTETKTGSN